MLLFPQGLEVVVSDSSKIADWIMYRYQGDAAIVNDLGRQGDRSKAPWGHSHSFTEQSFSFMLGLPR